MPLEFEHVLTGIGIRSRKVQCNAAIERFAASIEKRGIDGLAWRKRLSAQRLNHIEQRRDGRGAE